MKKILGVLIGALALASIGSAEGLASCSVGSDNTFSITNLLTGGSLASGCQIGDYQFTNFAVTGDPDTPLDNVETEFALQGQQVHLDLEDIGETGTFNTNFGLTYTITIDTVLDPQNELSATSAGILDGGLITPVNVTWQEDVNTAPGNVFLGMDVVTDTNAGNPTSTGPVSFVQPSLDIVDSYSVTIPGDIYNLSNSFVQTFVAAEPSTMILMGVALIGLGVVVRKRRKACA